MEFGMNQSQINMFTDILITSITDNILRNPNLKSYHGAVVIDKKQVYFGFNSTRTSWIQRMYARRVGMPKKSLEHAEIAALKQADNPKELLVIRLSKTGRLMESRPCPICMAAIKDTEIHTIYYSNEYGEIVKEKIL